MSTAVIKSAGDVASYGDNIDKMSQKMGLSAEAYQEWDAIMQHSGTSIESLQSGMKTLANAVEKGNDAFSRLGITQDQIASMDNEQLFSATITALQNVENETERTYLAGQLLGRGATELGALLNTSAEDTEAMRQRVHELGGVMSNEAVKAAAAYQDSLQDMQTAFQGLSRGMLSNFLPAMTTVMDGLTEIFSGNGNTGIGMVSDGLAKFAENISAQIPRIVSVGTEIITSLSKVLLENAPMMIKSGFQAILEFANGLSDSLPELIPVAVDAILQITEALIDNVDQLIDAAIAIILALAEGLIDALPKLIEKAPEIIAKLVSALIRNAPKIAKAGIDLMEELGKGIATMFSYIGKIGTTIIDTIKSGIMQKIADARQWGIDLIQNFIGGITSKISALKDTVSNVAQTVKNLIGFSEPKEGPLSNFHTYAPDMMALFAQGIRDNAKLVQNQLDKSLNFDFGTANVDFASSGIGRASAGIINGVSAGGQVQTGGTTTINLVLQDGAAIASWQLPFLIKAANANGTPIVSMQTA